MKKRGISVAATLIACVFIVTIIAFAYCVYSDYKSGIENARGIFDDLADHTMESSSIYPCGSKEFINAFNSAVNSPNSYEQLRLEVDGIEVYLYPAIPKNSNSIFVKTFNRTILGGDGARIELSANIYTLSPSAIFHRAKIAFIVILTGTLATCILLMYVYLNEAEKKEDKEKKEIIQNGFKKQNEYEESALSDDDIDLPDEDDLDIEDGPIFDDDEDTVIEETPQDVQQKNNEPQQASQPEPVEKATEILEAVVEAEPITESQTEESESGEQGLFSPASGFGWESYINERLESELVRAASSEQDLSLVMIKIPGITSTSSCYKDICKALLDFFQFKDFIFEYKTDGFAAIIQNKDVDSAMESAESLYANIVSILNKAGKKLKPFMGISSRSLRLISVDRLRTEAEQALLHATEDSDSPIVAFRVNPEKYRQYINTQN